MCWLRIVHLFVKNNGAPHGNEDETERINLQSRKRNSIERTIELNLDQFSRTSLAESGWSDHVTRVITLDDGQDGTNSGRVWADL